jgi:hypothetical protein
VTLIDAPGLKPWVRLDIVKPAGGRSRVSLIQSVERVVQISFRRLGSSSPHKARDSADLRKTPDATPRETTDMLTLTFILLALFVCGGVTEASASEQL